MSSNHADFSAGSPFPDIYLAISSSRGQPLSILAEARGE
jgi:hypothetical protein